MMDLQTIEAMTRKAARDAKRVGKEPMLLREEQLARAKRGHIESLRHIPNLGSHLPKGWGRVRLEKEHGVYMGDNKGYGAFMVDASGFGQPGEPALTFGEFIDKLKPGLGYALVEVGQFQVKVGVYAMVTQH